MSKRVEKFEPLNDSVLLEPISKLPEMYKAKVVAVGPGLTFGGKRLKPAAKVGDIVLIKRYPHSDVFFGKKRYFIVSDRSILLRLKKGRKK